MKNFLTKAFVCAGVLASALALSATSVFATVSGDKFWNQLDTTFKNQTLPDAGKSLAVDDLTIYGKMDSIATDKSERTFSDNTKLSGYIKTGGGSTIQKKDNTDTLQRVIAFTPTVDGNVTVYFRGGGSGNRSVYITQTVTATNRDTTNIIGSGTSSEQAVAMATTTSTANADNPIYIYGDTSVLVYGIKFTAASTDPTISVSGTSGLSVVAGKSTSFTATLKNPQSSTDTIVPTSENATVTFVKDDEKSSDTKIVGTVTVTAPSTASGKINVKLNAIGATEVPVEISVVAAELTVTPTELSIYKGASATFTATVNTGDEITIDTQGVEGITATKSDDTVTVAVSSSIAVEKATIKVSSGNLTKDVTVNIKSPISITPDPLDNTYTYTFKGHKGDVLTTDSKLAGKTAYASNFENTSVNFIEEGAQLTDNNDKRPAQLNVPIPAMASGKLTVEGSIIPTNKIGSKWALVSIGDKVYIGTDSSKEGKDNLLYATMATSLSGSATNHAGTVTANTPLVYSVTLDFDSMTFSGTLTNGNETATYADVPFEAIENNTIIFKTNDGGSGNDARTTVIPSVSYTVSGKEKVSVKYNEASNLTGINATDVAVTAKYVYANSTGYFVLDFDVKDVPANVTGFKYNELDIPQLYKKVKFADNDEITAADDHGLYAFKVDNGAESYSSVSATVTAKTAE